MSESVEPGVQAIFTHSPWRGDAASRSAAVWALGGRSGDCCRSARGVVDGAAMSAARMCAECSSMGADDAARSEVDDACDDSEPTEGETRCSEQAERREKCDDRHAT